jgi:hypothetical protein
MRRLSLALALTTLPALVWATPYDGTYRQRENAECALVGVDGGALRIEGGIFYGVEVECVMSRPVDVLDMDATLYTMNCTGEDQNWTERVMLMNAAGGDGIIMVWNGYAFRYSRCPESAAPVDTTVTPEIRPDDLAVDPEAAPVPAAD